jgi:hypothetical protein
LYVPTARGESKEERGEVKLPTHYSILPTPLKALAGKLYRVGLDPRLMKCLLIYILHCMVLRVHTLHLSGGYYEKVTPVPIPNTAVKLLSADDTWTETSWESRSPPDLYQGPVGYTNRALFCVQLFTKGTVYLRVLWISSCF